eukprot:scaffold25167_cov75-Attheya_sp.AAC.1
MTRTLGSAAAAVRIPVQRSICRQGVAARRAPIRGSAEKKARTYFFARACSLTARHPTNSLH